MNKYNLVRTIKISSILFLFMTSCQKKEISEFGFDASISGMVVDQTNAIVAGDITSANLVVRALGDGDQVTTDIRVKGDGTFGNDKMYPKKYRVWVSGPVKQVSDTLVVDLSQKKSNNYNFVVTPFITIDKPAVVANSTDSTVSVTYKLTANAGNSVSKRELYCSTIPYPTTSTGSGPYYYTKKTTLNNNSGTVVVTGLFSKTKYFIRIGAQASSSGGFNYSEQTEITTN